jgi:hypothetical protein
MGAWVSREAAPRLAADLHADARRKGMQEEVDAGMKRHRRHVDFASGWYQPGRSCAIMTAITKGEIR